MKVHIDQKVVMWQRSTIHCTKEEFEELKKRVTTAKTGDDVLDEELSERFDPEHSDLYDTADCLTVEENGDKATVIMVYDPEGYVAANGDAT